RLVAHQLCGPKKGEGGSNPSDFFARTRKKQHGIATSCVMDEVLAGIARLAGLRLAFPVQQFAAHGIVLIHRAWRKLLFRFLKANQGSVRLNFRKMESAYSSYTC